MRRNEAMVGAVVLLAIGLVGAGMLWLNGAALGRQERTIVARFHQVGQLTSGNPVKFRGVPIGRVDDVSIEPLGAGVRVEMSIDADVSLPPDPVVLLSPQSLFGDWQAEISTRARYPYYAFAEPSDAEVLPGYSMPDVAQITAVADRIAENLAVLTDRVEQAFTEETAENLRRAIENIQAVSAELTGLVASQREGVEELSEQLESMARNLGLAAEYAQRTFQEVDAAVGEGELRQIVTHLNRTSAQLDSMSAALVATTDGVGTAVASAERAFGAVEDIAVRVQAGEGTLGQLVQDSALYLDLVRTNVLLQTLIADIQQNPRKYINLRLF